MQQENQTNYTGINRWLRSGSVQTLLDQWHDGTIREFLDDWKWIFSFSGRYRGAVIFYTLLGIFGSTLSLGASWVSRILINIIVEKQYQNLWFLITVMVFSTVFSFVLNSLLGRIGLKISLRVNNDIRADIFHRIIDAEWSELSRFSNGDLLNRFGRDAGAVAHNAVGWIPNLIITLYSFCATFLLLFRTDPNMAYIALGSAPFLFVMSRYFMRQLRDYKSRVLEMNSEMMSFEVETFYHFDMLKSFGVTEGAEKKLRGWQEKYRDYNLDYNKFEIRAKLGISLVSAAVSMLAFGYCLRRLWTGQILYGDMTFFLQQRSALTGRFNSLVGTVPGMITAAVSAHRIRELTELPREVHDPASLAALSRTAEQGITVRMSDVSFAYRADQPVYAHGEFLACPGEIAAVLGPSGEGKTTMLRLLLGLLHPAEGSVTLTDAAGNSFPVNADLRRLFSYVPQGNSLLAGTVAENLRLVKEDASDAELIAALQTACAWEFIGQLPDGINAPVGERGAGFSEGQAQRIAIARALLRDAPILLLDEATAALDAQTEQRVLENILRACPGKTCIVSTHRMSILPYCRRVYHIRDRKLEE